MRVRDVMSRRLATVGEDDTVGLAVQAMLWMAVRHLPVVREGRLVGLITERDVLSHRARLGDHTAFAMRVGDAMVSQIAVADPDDPLIDAAGRMASDHIGCLPVVSEESLVGILTTTDVLTAEVKRDLQWGAPIGPVAGELMTRRPLTAEADDLLVEAVEAMIEAGVRHLPVVDGEDRVVGILSDRDARVSVGLPYAVYEQREARLRVETLRVGSAMHEDPLTVGPETSFAELVGLFADRRVGALPVVDARERLVGMVSYVDVLRAIRRH